MKKKILALIFASTFLLSACGENAESTVENANADGVIEDVNDAEDKEADEELDEVTELGDGPEQQVGDIIEAEAGIREILAVNYGIDESMESGPFTITVKNAQLSQFEPSEDMVDFFDGESLGMVALEVEAVHNSEETNAIYPDQGILVTDTGHQIDADVFLSDDVGGDFYGKVKKSGDIFFFFDDDASDVKNVRFIVGSPYDENFDTVGEDIEFIIDF